MKSIPVPVWIGLALAAGLSLLLGFLVVLVLAVGVARHNGRADGSCPNCGAELCTDGGNLTPRQKMVVQRRCPVCGDVESVATFEYARAVRVNRLEP